tara:strand:- start:1059 stop:1229 length:171 start_codon:yes stop_codon:yes gene_type:complete
MKNTLKELKQLKRKLDLINYYYPNRKKHCNYDAILKEYQKNEFLYRLDSFIKNQTI